MQKRRVCMFFNDLALYRKAIYKKLDEVYDCEWYIQDVDTGVKEFDRSELKSVHVLHVKEMGRFYLVKGLLSLLKKDFDIYFVLGETGNITLFFFCLFKRIFYSKKRVYFWTHGFYGKENRILLELWKKPLFHLADGVFTYGEYAKEIMVKEGFNANNIYPIHNSLSYDEQLMLRNSLAASNIYKEHFGIEAPVLIMIGRLNIRKHLDMLLYAISNLKKKNEHYNVVLIGDGEDRAKLEKIVAEEGLDDHVWFYGACYDEKTNAELLYNADMCVVPGDIGLTAIHSLMFGVPAITHNCFKYQGPEFEAIKPGITGDFYEYGNIESLSATIHRWFSNHSSNRVKVRLDCYSEIDNFWTPYYQMEIIDKHLL